MQCVKCSVACALQVSGSANDTVIHLDDFGRECQEGGILQPPFHVRFFIDLISQRLAGDPLNLAVPHPSKDLLYGFGLSADSKLCLIIGEAIQTARVEVNFHAVSRLSLRSREISRTDRIRENLTFPPSPIRRSVATASKSGQAERHIEESKRIGLAQFRHS